MFHRSGRKLSASFKGWLGLTRVKDILDGHTIALPANLTMVGDSGRGILIQAASQLGYTVSWVDEESRARELHAPYQIQTGDFGPALIGGLVRSIVRRTTHEGVGNSRLDALLPELPRPIL